MKVSVVIPTYNRPELLYRVLYRLLVQQDPDYEVLVSIDDDEELRPRSCEVCAEFEAQTMPIRVFMTGQFKRGVNWSSQEGWSAGQGWSLESYPYNVGIRHAQGGLVLLNSGDTMSISRTLDQHRQWHLAHDEAVLVSTVHALSKQTQETIEKYPWREDPATLLFDGSCADLYVGDGQSYLPGRPRLQVLRPLPFQMSVPRHALWYIRGFDEDFFGRMPYADDDLADRLTRLGLGFHYSADAVAAHQWHAAPDMLTKHSTAKSNDYFDSGKTLFLQRSKEHIIRNVKHEWGQYPRDLRSLPWISGAAPCAE